MKKFKFYIQYFNKYGTTKHIIIKAKDEDHAEIQFYKKIEPYGLIKKISLV